MIVDDEEMVTLPIQIVHELFQYIHPDLKYIIHRSNNSDKRLHLSIIMKSNLEDYFEDVLLSDRFKPLLTDACASYGQLDGELLKPRTKKPRNLELKKLEFGKPRIE